MASMPSRVSAGILLYRLVDGRLEVLLAHMGGPLHASRDLGTWTIPKGEAEPGEVEPGEVEPGEVEPGEVEPADAEPADAEPGKAEPGSFDPDHARSLLAVARREFAEETGHALAGDRFMPLGSIVQKGGKIVHAWASEGDLDPALAHSNTFRMIWPLRSGIEQEFPEIDRVAWFAPTEARARIKATQIPFIDRLEVALERAGSEP